MATLKCCAVRKTIFPRKNSLKKFFFRLCLMALTLTIVIIIYLQVRLSNLMKFKDLIEIHAKELNIALKSLPKIPESFDSWRQPKLDKSRIFSAYLDTRPEVVLEVAPELTYKNTSWALVRIIAIIPVPSESTPLTCYFKFRGPGEFSGTNFVSRAWIKSELLAVRENFGMYYSAAYILCPLPKPEDPEDEIKLPISVTVSTEPNETLDTLDNSRFVVIRYPEDGFGFDSKARKLFSVCVQPLHHQFAKAEDLIAFVEFYRMMGVRQFMFYRDSVSQTVDQVLNYYQKLDNGVGGKVAGVFQWKLPRYYEFERSLRVDGIYAALNDCLYRSTFHKGYHYVAAVDVDEYIVPRIHRNFLEMMEHLNPTRIRTWVGAWIFRNAFFYLMFNNDTTVTSLPGPPLNFHLKTTRWEEINPAHDRSKFIVQGRDVIELGNHRIWRMKRMWSIFGRRYKEVSVDPEISTSNHYRNCETLIEKCWRRRTITDRTAHRFSTELLQRVVEIEKNIFLDNFPLEKSSP